MQYDKLALRYDRVIKRNFEDYDSILSVVAALFVKYKNILDFGAGTGELALKICRKNKKAKITLIDESSEMLKLTKEKIKNAGFKKQVKFINSNKIPKNKRYDAIASTFTIYLMDRKEILPIFSKHIKKGGLLVLTDVCREGKKGELNAGIVRFLQKITFSPLANFYEPETLQKLLEDSGFHKTNLVKTGSFKGLPVYLITAIKR